MLNNQPLSCPKLTPISLSLVSLNFMMRYVANENRAHTGRNKRRTSCRLVLHAKGQTGIEAGANLRFSVSYLDPILKRILDGCYWHMFRFMDVQHSYTLRRGDEEDWQTVSLVLQLSAFMAHCEICRSTFFGGKCCHMELYATAEAVVAPVLSMTGSRTVVATSALNVRKSDLLGKEASQSPRCHPSALPDHIAPSRALFHLWPSGDVSSDLWLINSICPVRSIFPTDL